MLLQKRSAMPHVSHSSVCASFISIYCKLAMELKISTCGNRTLLLKSYQKLFIGFHHKDTLSQNISIMQLYKCIHMINIICYRGYLLTFAIHYSWLGRANISGHNRTNQIKVSSYIPKTITILVHCMLIITKQYIQLWCSQYSHTH